MKIAKELKEEIERFLYQYPNTEEYGGFLFSKKRGRTEKASVCLYIPNCSDLSSCQFRFPNKAKQLAEKLAFAKRLTVLAMWHSHPKPYIMSVGDVTVAENEDLIFLMISRKDEYGKTFVWYACKGIKPEEIDFV